MGEIVKDLGTTLRSLARQPGMALIVVLTLALGVGASTAPASPPSAPLAQSDRLTALPRLEKGSPSACWAPWR